MISLFIISWYKKAIWLLSVFCNLMLFRQYTALSLLIKIVITIFFCNFVYTNQITSINKKWILSLFIFLTESFKLYERRMNTVMPIQLLTIERRKKINKIIEVGERDVYICMETNKQIEINIKIHNGCLITHLYIRIY